MLQAEDWVVDGWQTDAGLPHSAVNSIVQTRDGYLWLGTSNGLARFDGVRFNTIQTGDALGLRSNRILCLYEDTRGVLWVGAEAGGVARHQNGRFTSLGSVEGLSSDTVLCLGEDRAGALWVGTDSGLNRRDAEGISVFFKTDGLPDDRVNAISLAEGERMLVATEKGLCRFSRDVLRPLETELPVSAHAGVRFLHSDTQGQLWLGGEPGLFRLQDAGGRRPGAGKAVTVWSEPVLSFVERADCEFWFGTAKGELLRVRADENPPVPRLVWRATRPVLALCEDREGNIWAGTAGDGLHRIKRRQLRLLPLPETQSGSWPACFFETTQGELRFVAGDKGLYRCRADGCELLEKLPLPNGVVVQTVQSTLSDELWLGTLRDGLFRWSIGALRQFSERDGLSDSAIEVLYATRDGGLWIGTRNGGLNFFKDEQVTRFNTPWGFFGTYACALELDLHGNLWIGTTGDGLFQLRDGRFTAFNEASLSNADVRTIHADREGAVWVGTSRGLCRIKDGRVTAFESRSGVPDEAVFQLQSDREGNLWVGSANRIFRVPKQELDAYAEGHARFVNVVHYGKEDGLPAVQCRPRSQAQNRRGGGGIWFATTRGLVRMDHGAGPWNRLTPPVMLESVLVDNVSLPFGEGVRVAPGKESLRFEYTAMSLTAPGKVNFRYQLEGFDRDWSEASPSRTARYPKVPPGQYTFRVIACNNDGVWNETGASVAVAVIPFWWETTWFRLALVIAVAGILFGLYRSRQARRRELERLRVRIASDLHDDIGSSLWSITLLSRMLAKHGEFRPDERQDLEEIHRISTQTSNSIRDIIWLINPAFDTMQDLVLRTKDFASTLLRGVDYRLQCGHDLLGRKLPFDFRHNLFLFFKEALTNVARHARAATVEVRVEAVDKRWQITIQDNGAGFDPAACAAGNGLKNLRGRAARMQGKFDIQSRPGHGTTITLSVAPP